MPRRAGTWRAARAAWGVCRAGIVAIIALALTAGWAAAHPPDPPPGTPDVGFGAAGVVLTDVGRVSLSGRGVVTEEDGKIVAAGVAIVDNAPSFALVRYRRDGALDPTFGVGGVVATPFVGALTLAGIVLQPDGRIVVAGTVATGNNIETIAVARYRRDGQLDETFGTNGQVFTDFGAGFIARAAAVALQSDGRIVVVGLTTAGGTLGSRNMLARYDPDGSLDGTFGVGGRMIADFGNAAGQILLAVTIGNDGKIVVAGSSKQYPTSYTATVARFEHDGSLDPTFGNGGAVLIQFGGLSEFSAVAVQRDGRIVTGGSGPFGGLLARFAPDGTLDATFGAGGAVRVAIGAASAGTVSAIRLDRCDRIVAATQLFQAIGSSAAVVRYDRDGASDPAFGNGGAAVTTLDGLYLDGEALAIARDGDIVLAGNAQQVVNPALASFLVARYDGGGDRGCECGPGARGF